MAAADAMVLKYHFLLFSPAEWIACMAMSCTTRILWNVVSNELCKVLGSACGNNGEDVHLSYSADNIKSNFFLTVSVNMANANIVVSHCVDMVELPGTMECLEEKEVQSI